MRRGAFARPTTRHGQVLVGAAAPAMAGAVDASAAVVDLSRVGAGQAEWQCVAAGHRRVLRPATTGHAAVAHAALVYEQRAPDERRHLERARDRALGWDSGVEQAITAMGAS